jgi:hypothetical protein
VNAAPLPTRAADPPPRGLLLLAALWLVGSIAVSFGLTPPLLAASSTYAPAVRTTLLVLLAGGVVAWPLLRLSGPRPRQPFRRLLLDLLVVAGTFTIAIWPLRLTTPWSTERTLAILLTMIAWVLVVAGPVLWGIRRRSGSARTLAMAAIAAILLAGAVPALATRTGEGIGVTMAFADPDAGRWQPFVAVLQLAAPAGTDLPDAMRILATTPLLLAVPLLAIAVAARPREAAAGDAG